ncbi:DNA-binding transcriptional regulator, CsgD family [Pseudomonas linyingensis]|uniref:DNA-binding transcriptional regulator, CsgD family n=1 Tax=Pseudomonas linyingensis TaxID=915471 RepID=A0A1H6ZM80_9PSED|nr:helix-turn-helix transcriptional regulator [Pseudomonas linyingensis]SEJ54501.1 DNA-binding transcriptional regulator, CsgD family [Pseudomonas linyingensis]
MEAVAVLKRPVTPSPVIYSAVLPELIGLVYEGLNEARPWGALAERLRQVLGAINVTVTLLHAEDRPSDIQVMSVEEGDDTDWLLAERLYRERFTHIKLVDPKSLPPGEVIVFGPEDVETECAAHMAFLNLASCLRTCFAEPGGMRCWIDVIRGHSDPERPFAASDRELIGALLPHLTRALGLYARLKRQEAEKSIYEGCLDHLVLGCLLLDGDAQLLCVNQAARAIIDKHRGIELNHGRVLLQERAAQQALEKAIANALAARAQEGGHYRGELVRLQARDGVLLGMLATPAPLIAYYQGRHVPSVIIYLSELTESLAMQQVSGGSAAELIAQLLDLTRQEARLAALLACGQTISEAAGQMGIAVTAARNYSKNIYAKLGIKGQNDLVRILFKSFALLR